MVLLTMRTSRYPNQAFVKLEISREKLEQLFVLGKVKVEDFRCPNDEAQECLWQLCLLATISDSEEGGIKSDQSVKGGGIVLRY